MRAVNGFYGFVEHPKQQLLIIGCCFDTVAIYILLIDLYRLISSNIKNVQDHNTYKAL